MFDEFHEKLMNYNNFIRRRKRMSHFAEPFERGRERARKEANIRRVISMIANSKSDEDKQKVVDFMNKNKITPQDVQRYVDKINKS